MQTSFTPQSFTYHTQHALYNAQTHNVIQGVHCLQFQTEHAVQPVIYHKYTNCIISNRHDICSTLNRKCMRTRRRHACSHVTVGLPEPVQCGASCTAACAPEGPAGCHLATQAQGQQPHAPCCAAAEQLPHWQLPVPHRGSRVEVSCHPLLLSSLSAAPAIDQLFMKHSHERSITRP